MKIQQVIIKTKNDVLLPDIPNPNFVINFRRPSLESNQLDPTVAPVEQPLDPGPFRQPANRQVYVQEMEMETGQVAEESEAETPLSDMLTSALITLRIGMFFVLLGFVISLLTMFMPYLVNQEKNKTFAGVKFIMERISDGMGIIGASIVIVAGLRMKAVIHVYQII